MSGSEWDFGDTADGFPMAWYTPEGFARATAWQQEYVESGRCAHDEAVLAVYAADPAGVLAAALIADIGAGIEGMKP